MKRISMYAPLLLAGLFTIVKTNGQQKIGNKPPAFIKDIPNLKVGDSLPNLKIQNIIFGDKRTIQTGDFKDRLLILDFWDTYCGSCIAAMPKMEKLQQTFGTKIKVLPVTWQEEGYVRNFWKKNTYTKNIHIPTVVEDSILYSYFRHHGAPHEIWIYKGKVIGITDGEHVDEKNVRAVLEGGRPSLPLKYDFYPAYDGSKPLFATNPDQTGERSNLLRYAAISDYKSNIGSGGLAWSEGEGIVKDSSKKIIRIYFVNTPIWMTR